MEEELKALLEDFESLKRSQSDAKSLHSVDEVGMTKTDAAVQTLSDINPDVVLESYSLNITTVKGFEIFMESLKAQGSQKSGHDTGVDLVLSCVDNYEARMVVNQVYLKMLFQVIYNCWFLGKLLVLHVPLLCVVDDSGMEISNGCSTSEGLIHELPGADKYPESLVVGEACPVVDDLDDLQRQLDALNTS
ncbi:hypothetical protein COCNU_02G014290 [Cocos nucifera]|uniref:THIF-type NAD/FAD binding fold domain-containing protein n=1 Tax=Cocos nucifera TaxID=13894 RepID=A0A8K0MX96_COCNU|nr:hypothetical protein COCNU_02G014290 [Cocos nucifera]